MEGFILYYVLVVALSLKNLGEVNKQMLLG